MKFIEINRLTDGQRQQLDIAANLLDSIKYQLAFALIGQPLPNTYNWDVGKKDSADKAGSFVETHLGLGYPATMVLAKTALENGVNLPDQIKACLVFAQIPQQ